MRLASLRRTVRRPIGNLSWRSYSASLAVRDEQQTLLTKEEKRKAAIDYNARRAVYRKEVSYLRKEYASEVALQRAADQAERAAKRQEETRKKLQRQRLKNMRSAANAKRQKELRELRRQEWEEELRVAQVNRNARNAQFAETRQSLIDELEEEAPLWLTTREEVEAAFDSRENEQMLWARPNSVLGAPVPTEDAEFWKYESHTWHMDKTYTTRREVLLEELLERAYQESNIDQSFWSADRVAERKALEEKAKLRAMVRDEGKKALLLKQRQLLQDESRKTGDDDLARPVPVPNVQILANIEAMEKEGASLLLKDPTQFFEFENTNDTRGDDATHSEYTGPTLGVPIGLKDPIRSGTPQYRPFPLIFGKELKADTRTEREKKREEKENAMWAASRANELSIDDDFDVSDLTNTGDGVDYSKLQYDSDEEWEEGLDPVEDAELFKVARQDRYNEEEVEWVIERLERKAKDLEEELDFAIETARQEIQARSETGENEEDKSSRPDDSSAADDAYTIKTGGGVYRVTDFGVDANELESLMESLSEEQMISLHALESRMDVSSSTEERKQILAEVPGITQEQIDGIVRLEETLAKSEVFGNEDE